MQPFGRSLLTGNSSEPVQNATTARPERETRIFAAGSDRETRIAAAGSVLKADQVTPVREFHGVLGTVDDAAVRQCLEDLWDNERINQAREDQSVDDDQFRLDKIHSEFFDSIFPVRTPFVIPVFIKPKIDDPAVHENFASVFFNTSYEELNNDQKNFLHAVEYRSDEPVDLDRVVYYYLDNFKSTRERYAIAKLINYLQEKIKNQDNLGNVCFVELSPERSSNVSVYEDHVYDLMRKVGFLSVETFTSKWKNEAFRRHMYHELAKCLTDATDEDAKKLRLEYLKDAEKSYPEDMWEVAKHYKQIQGKEDEALRRYKALAVHGHRGAIRELARIYAEDDTKFPNLSAAANFRFAFREKLCEHLNDNGHHDAINLALCYFHGKGVRRDTQKAVELLYSLKNRYEQPLLYSYDMFKTIPDMKLRSALALKFAETHKDGIKGCVGFFELSDNPLHIDWQLALSGFPYDDNKRKYFTALKKIVDSPQVPSHIKFYVREKMEKVAQYTSEEIFHQVMELE